MTTRVPSEHIEALVGAKRDPLGHIGRAVSSEDMFYILHSGECFTTLTDLRECEFSRALDRGITQPWPMDEPVVLAVDRGLLAPDRREWVPETDESATSQEGDD